MVKLTTTAMRRWRGTASPELRQALDQQARAEPWNIGDDAALTDDLYQLGAMLDTASGLAALGDPARMELLRIALLWLGPDRRLAIIRNLGSTTLKDGTVLATTLIQPSASHPNRTQLGDIGTQLVQASLQDLARRELLGQVLSPENLSIVEAALRLSPVSAA